MNQGTGGGKQSFSLLCEPVVKEVPIMHVCVCVFLGWRPRRTIIFASWDAEEFGLLGSTEWAEVDSYTDSHALTHLYVPSR